MREEKQPLYYISCWRVLDSIRLIAEDRMARIEEAERAPAHEFWAPKLAQTYRAEVERMPRVLAHQELFRLTNATIEEATLLEEMVNSNPDLNRFELPKGFKLKAPKLSHFKSDVWTLEKAV